MMLQLSGVHAHYGHIHALHGVDVAVQVGEVVTLIGANGAGKSTLMMSIFGQPPASGGRIVFDGEDITALPTHEIARRGISLVPEGRRIFPRMMNRPFNSSWTGLKPEVLAWICRSSPRPKSSPTRH